MSNKLSSQREENILGIIVSLSSGWGAIFILGVSMSQDIGRNTLFYLAGAFVYCGHKHSTAALHGVVVRETKLKYRASQINYIRLLHST